MEMQKSDDGQFINADCLDAMKNIPDGSVDMVLCDLPYGTTQNKWDSVIPLDGLWTEYLRIAKPSAAFSFTASQPFTSTLVTSRRDLFKHEWIWIKNKGSNFANTVREPFKEHESVLVFSRGKWTYNKQMQPRTGGGISRVKYAFSSDVDQNSSSYGIFNGNQKTQATELRVPSSWLKFNCEMGLHPTQKPTALFEYLIKTYTNKGDTVLDNCAGSGTTAIAAINTNRKWICIEKDAEYSRIAVERIKSHRKPIDLFTQG